MGDKKKKGKAEKVIVDGVETSEMKFPKLQEFAATLLIKLNDARRDRIFLQAQCAQMRSAWEITKMNHQDTKYQIKATAMQRDKLEVDVCSQTIKEMTDLEKFLAYNLNEKVNKMGCDTVEMIKDIESKWDQDYLQPLLEKKTQLKLGLEQTIKDNNELKKSFQGKIEQDTSDYVKAMDKETDKIIENQIKRLTRDLDNIKLLSQSSFFKTQKDYNSVIVEMMENGNKNTGLLREFYKRITEDDIIMIMVLEKEVRKLKKIVSKKHTMCKKINEQSAAIESSKGELEMNLGRAKRKMKLYDTNTLALDRTNYICDKLTEKKNINAKELKEINLKEIALNDKLRKMEDYIKQYNTIFETRRKEIFEPLRNKIKILNSIIKKDRLMIESVIPNLQPESQEEAKNIRKHSDEITSKCMTYLIFDLARMSRTHDDFIDFIEGSLSNLNVPEQDRLQFQRINFDATQYEYGPLGLITKYP